MTNAKVVISMVIILLIKLSLIHAFLVHRSILTLVFLAILMVVYNVILQSNNCLYSMEAAITAHYFMMEALHAIIQVH